MHRNSIVRSALLANLICLMILACPDAGHAQPTERASINIDGRHLSALVDPIDGRIHRLINARRADIRIGGRFEHLGKGDEQIVEQAAREFVRRHQDLLQLSAKELGKAHIIATPNFWSLTFSQVYRGVPVQGGSFGLTVDREGRVIALGVSADLEIDISAVPSLTAHDALEVVLRAIDGLGEPVGDPHLLILPENRHRETLATLAWKVIVASPERNPGGISVFWVDAHTGRIVRELEAGKSWIGQRSDSTIAKMVSNTSTVSGQVKYSGFREPTQPQGVVALPNSTVLLNGQTVYTDNNGMYTFSSATSGTLTFALATPYARSIDHLGLDDVVHTVQVSGSSTENCVWPREIPETASDRANAVVLATEMNNYFRSAPFWYPFLDEQIVISSGIGTPPTAPYFGQAFPQSGPTGQLKSLLLGPAAAASSDIVYHEYTHLMISELYRDPELGPMFISGDALCDHGEMPEACAMDEGFADYFSGAKNRDPIYADQAIPSDPDKWRTLDNDLTMSDFNSEPHHNGQIIAGAVWDLTSSQGFYMNSGQPADFDEYVDYRAYWALFLSPPPPWAPRFKNT